MNYFPLGNSDLVVSEIAFGGMSLKTDGASLVLNAFEQGITLFDTADIYDNGANETLIGTTLKPHRKDVILATKVGNQPKSSGKGWDWNPSKKYILESVEKSLQRLQTDYIDLYQLHGGTIEDPIDETIEAFELLVERGKIRAYGISSIRPNVIQQYAERSNIASVMMQYSLLDRRPEEEAFPLLANKGISVIARGSVAKGLLAGKKPDSFLNYSAEEVKTAADGIAQLSTDDRNPAATAIRFALYPSIVTTAVVGIRTHEHLEDAIRASNATLDTAEFEELGLLLPVHNYTEHRI